MTPTPAANGSSSAHRWRFFRSGGFDQVRLETGADLAALGTLDQKLWSALSCPARGLEFDARTLDLIDADRDGRIRVPDILAAVRWAVSLVRDPDELTRSADALPLAAIDDTTDEGKRLLACARRILANLGKADAEALTLDDVTDAGRLFAQTRFNGDGVIPPDAADDEFVRGALLDVTACGGAEGDAAREPGVDQTLADAFFADAQAYSDWCRRAEDDPARLLPLGEATAAAAAALGAVKAKVVDYFARCSLAAYDPEAEVPLNPAEEQYRALGAQDLSAGADGLAGFPVARVAPGRPLPLGEGVNPAWRAAVETFRNQGVGPLLGPRDALTEGDWAAVGARLAPFEAWQAEKAGARVEHLGLERVRALLESGARGAIDALLEKDRALEPEVNAVEAVERLLRYHRHLFTLVNNFVSFRDFYQRTAKAVFQAGTLFLDGRSCDLCVRVADQARHGALATLSRTYLAYCDCTRQGTGEKMTIAAAFTAGDSDHLMVGRNGVFYDRSGGDWDATIVKIIDHPISLRQAFWAPYKRVARMIAEQVEKFAAAKAKNVEDKAAAGVADVSGKLSAPTPPPSAVPPFDVGKFAGIFAAIGLAMGALGTAAASVVTGFLGLRWWQMPLALAGLVLAVSGPSVVLAWLKLRQRNLAPILDANGWAVNTRAKINIAFGGALTSVARLPEGADRSLADPFAEKKRPWKLFAALAAAGAAAAAYWALR